MKIALVHDYLNEFGGAERVLKVLADMYPKAPIYTAFVKPGSSSAKVFGDKKIVQSWLSPLLKFWKLYSPLRFLIPVIWGSFDLSGYDLIITSASWYVTRGFKIGKNTKVICYCHTPPRWLYGFETSVGFTKYLPVKIYSLIVGHFIRMYDFLMAQMPKRDANVVRGGVDLFVANSENVKKRIEKFYRRDAKVIYPPVSVSEIINASQNTQKEDYYLIVSRLVGAKGLEHAVSAFKSIDKKLFIVGEAYGYSNLSDLMEKQKNQNVKLLGRVDDEKLFELYAKAKGFIALARDEDFGMTVVESQAAGTPVIAFNGGGFKESVIDGKTGILINDTNIKTIKEAVSKLENKRWDKTELSKNAKRFSKENFISSFERTVQNLK